MKKNKLIKNENKWVMPVPDELIRQLQIDPEEDAVFIELEHEKLILRFENY